jgi:hypothetical protein
MRQVFWLASLFIAFPSRKWRDSGMWNKQFRMKLTATGIAPDLHRTSLLMAVFFFRQPNERQRCQKNAYGKKFYGDLISCYPPTVPAGT